MEQVIFIEGLPGTGKSTVSNWITEELCNQGRNAVCFMEENRVIPTNFYHVAAMEQGEFDELCLNNPNTDKDLIQKELLNKPRLEEMSAFFNKRIDTYDNHMLNNVVGCKEGYIKMATLIPDTAKTMLDLGCGTGLELDEIFKVLPNLEVTGIDLTKGMLDKLKEKHPNNELILIHDNYLEYDFRMDYYNVAISFESLHHFSQEEKIKLYTKVYKSLVKDGIYIEADYMVSTQELENYYFEENLRIRAEMGVTEGFYHYDTPCTISNQISMLKKAGFITVDKVWQDSDTVILMAYKLRK